MRNRETLTLFKTCKVGLLLLHLFIKVCIIHHTTRQYLIGNSSRLRFRDAGGTLHMLLTCEFLSTPHEIQPRDNQYTPLLLPKHNSTDIFALISYITLSYLFGFQYPQSSRLSLGLMCPAVYAPSKLANMEVQQYLKPVRPEHRDSNIIFYSLLTLLDIK